MIQKTQLADKIKQINGKPWYPVDIIRANDQIVRIALFQGEFHWHKHKFDELFYVLKGKIIIQLKDSELSLGEGELATIPKGIEHCPKSQEESYVIMFEPLGK